MMIRFILGSVVFVGVLLSPFLVTAPSKEVSEEPKILLKSPNILLIIADDMGLDVSPWYDDYKGEKPNTPFLDGLAAKGLVFDNTWAHPMCSPTRSSIITGKYPIRTGVLGIVRKNDPGLSVDEMSLQRYIQENAPTDYAQAIIGKWHLSSSKNGGNNNPEIMGVPYYSGLISGGAPEYSRWNKVTNGVSTKEDRYITSVFTDEAIDWVGKQQDPWFLWLAYTAPHKPFHLPPADLVQTDLDGSDVEENPFPYYLLAIEAMDKEIGRLLSSLSEKERENTIIIFIGDNGTPREVVRRPFRKASSKGTLFEGGIHVPMIVSGKGVIKGREDRFVHTADLFTTIAELTGINPRKYEDSVSFAPLLFGKPSEDRPYLYSEIKDRGGDWNLNNGWTVRGEQYKYIELDNGDRYLFDLQKDPYEHINLYDDADSQDALKTLQEEGASIRSGGPGES